MIKVFHKIKSGAGDFFADNFLDFSHSVLWLFIVFGIGILYAYDAFPHPSSEHLMQSIYVLAAIVAANILFALCKKVIEKHHIKNRKFSHGLENFSDVLRVVSLVAFAFAAGCLRMNARTYFMDTAMLDEPVSGARVYGRLEEVEFFPDKYRLVVADAASEKIDDRINKLILHIDIDEFEKSAMKVGDEFAFIADVNPISTPTFIGDFNYRRYLYYRGISGNGQFDKIISVSPKSSENLSDAVANFRTNMNRHIKSNMSKDAGDVALTLITGERHAPRKKIQNDYKFSGISHLLSISGFHMTIIAGIVFLLVRKLLVLFLPISAKYDMKNFAYFITLLALTFYLFLSGARLSTQRAYIMAMAALCTFMMGKSPVSIRLLLLAGLIILMMTPEAIINAGFGLSFMAVMGLIIIFRLPSVIDFSRKLQSKSKISHALFISVLTSVAASFATSILTLYHFHEYPVWSVITNLIISPICVFLVMPMVVAFLVFNSLIPVASLDVLSLKAMDFCIQAINYITETIARMPYKTIYVNHMDGWIAGLFTIGFLMIVLFKTRHKFIGFIVTIVAIFCICFVRTPDIIINSNGNVFMRQSRWKIVGFNVRGDDDQQMRIGTKISIAKRFSVGLKNLKIEKHNADDVFYTNRAVVWFSRKIRNNNDVVCVDIAKQRFRQSREYCLTRAEIMEVYFNENNYETRFQ